MTSLPVTLTTAAAALFVNLWLGGRIARLRHQFKVNVGDGGHEPLLRRMRAQANFIEHAPIFLILLAALEISGGKRLPLAIIAVVFLLGRMAHGIGMDGGGLQRWRRIGMMSSTIASVALALWGLICAAGWCLGR